MNQLPSHWDLKRLKSLGENLDSKRVPITKAKRTTGDIPYYGASGIVDYVTDYIFNEDLLLISEDGANLLARTYPIAFSVSGKSWVNNHAHVLRFCENSTQRFVEYYLNSISLEPYVSGMAQPKLNQNSLNSILIPLPPLPEQKRIVAILDEAFAGISQAIANSEKNLANARELFESYLQAAIEGKCSSESSTDQLSEELMVPQSESLPRICEEETPFQLPKFWQWRRLGTLATFINGDRGKNYPNKKEYVPSGIPWINTGHIKPDGSLATDSMHYITKEKYDSLRSGKIEEGDLVYCLRGATIGKTAFVEPYTEGAVASSLVIIRPTARITPGYLYYFLKSPFGQSLIKRFDNGAAQPNLGANSVKQYVTPLPPLPEQVMIAERLDELHLETKRLETIYQQKLNALSELKQSILQKAFTGELTKDLPL